jgi:hypothetical protein
MAYTKFYVNPPWFQPLPHQNSQALVCPSFYQPLGPVSVRRRSAAHRALFMVSVRGLIVIAWSARTAASRTAGAVSDACGLHTEGGTKRQVGSV